MAVVQAMIGSIGYGVMCGLCAGWPGRFSSSPSPSLLERLRPMAMMVTR